jgi:hypothetical protein
MTKITRSADSALQAYPPKGREGFSIFEQTKSDDQAALSLPISWRRGQLTL